MKSGSFSIEWVGVSYEQEAWTCDSSTLACEVKARIASMSFCREIVREERTAEVCCRPKADLPVHTRPADEVTFSSPSVLRLREIKNPLTGTHICSCSCRAMP